MRSTPAKTSTANTSTSSAYHPCAPSHGSVACGFAAPIIAMTMVGNRTMKPQKIAACIKPGNSRCSSVRWPITSVASARARAGTLSKRAAGWPDRMRR